jgi:hypothetical protein
MTMMSELAPDGALVAGSLEQALERFKDSSDKTWGQIPALGDEDRPGQRFRV